MWEPIRGRQLVKTLPLPHEARQATVLAGGIGVLEVLFKKRGELKVCFGKIWIERNRGAESFGGPVVFLHPGQCSAEQEMGGRLGVRPLQPIERELCRGAKLPPVQGNAAEADIGNCIIRIERQRFLV